MKVLVTGSRDWRGTEAAGLIHERLSGLPKEAEIIVGDAMGADYLAATVARSLGLGLRVFQADWRRHGRGAGIIRNLRMLDEGPDLVLAFWCPPSRGTHHVIRNAKERGIPTEIHYQSSARFSNGAEIRFTEDHADPPMRSSSQRHIWAMEE